MNSSFENHPFFRGQPGEPVPEVSADDLKALWQEQRTIQARNPAKQVATGRAAAEHICPPGTNIEALGYRLSMLWLLGQIAPKQFLVFTKDGQPTDAVFHAAAKVSVQWMGEGIADRPPFNVDEFLRLCGEQ